jgi:hypothetical protein
VSENLLRERGRALEEAFFQRKHEQRERLALREKELAAREGLAEASGIRDRAVLARLTGLGIRAETLAALTLFPLVEVAWADGRMEEKERRAVLAGAESTGIEPGSPSHALLRLWLEDRPAPDLGLAWRAFIGQLCRELADPERRNLGRNIVSRARRVAEAAGGLLGLRDPVSEEEEAVLAELARAVR